MNACVIVPAYDAAKSLRAVILDLRDALPEVPEILVVDDGSRDDTARIARDLDVRVIVHERNRGKGGALKTGLAEAARLKFDVAMCVDADGQHPAASAREVLYGSTDPRALVLGVRDLVRDGAPPKNRWSNGISNHWLSRFVGRKLHDTQCGLRRYPVTPTLGLRTRADGYAFEAEVLLRAAAAGLPIIETPIKVHYPPENERITHFDSVRDPARIIGVVLRTVFELRFAPGAP